MIRLWRPKFIIPMVVLLALHISITTPVGQYIDAIGRADISSEGRSQMWQATRWYVGHFRAPPSDSEMIDHFNENRAKFETLVSSYYEAVRVKKSPSITEQTQVSERMDIGIYSFGTAGPFLFRDKSASFFFNTGVSLSLIDAGLTPWWSYGQRTYKEYIYIPELSAEQVINLPPLEHLLATGEYQSFGDADIELNPKRGPCVLKQIDNNWFIQRCIKYWD